MLFNHSILVFLEKEQERTKICYYGLSGQCFNVLLYYNMILSEFSEAKTPFGRFPLCFQRKEEQNESSSLAGHDCTPFCLSVFDPHFQAQVKCHLPWVNFSSNRTLTHKVNIKHSSCTVTTPPYTYHFLFSASLRFLEGKCRFISKAQLQDEKRLWVLELNLIEIV